MLPGEWVMLYVKFMEVIFHETVSLGTWYVVRNMVKRFNNNDIEFKKIYLINIIHFNPTLNMIIMNIIFRWYNYRQYTFIM